MPTRPGFGPWALASLVLFLLAAAALVLILGGGPLIPGAGAPTSSDALWQLPGWLELASLATLLLGFPAAFVCACVAYLRQSVKPFSTRQLWVVGILLVLFLALCSA